MCRVCRAVRVLADDRLISEEVRKIQMHDLPYALPSYFEAFSRACAASLSASTAGLYCA